MDECGLGGHHGGEDAVGEVGREFWVAGGSEKDGDGGGGGLGEDVF